jgi:hypothetical protein
MNSGRRKTIDPPRFQHEDICQVIGGKHAGEQVRIISISPLLTPIMYTCRILLGLHRGDQILVAQDELSTELDEL